MKVLDEIDVRLRPTTRFSDHVECRISVKVAGMEEAHYERIIPEDDFESFFHRAMRMAEQTIEELVAKVQGDMPQLQSGRSS
jgi:hypothetical protein